MNKAELIDAVAENANLTKHKATSAVDAVFSLITAAVARGDKVSLSGFGIFERSDRQARTGRNPQTGAVVQIAATYVPKFRAGVEFKIKVSGSGRNRSQGWTHAKTDGHANEDNFAEILEDNSPLVSTILGVVGKSKSMSGYEIKVDGSKKVDSIFGDKTTSKVDIEIALPQAERLNISLKKSDGGQVWLISVPRFVSAIEYHLDRKLSVPVKEGICLFIGGPNLVNVSEKFDHAIAHSLKTTPLLAKQELHQNRLVGSTIRSLFPEIWDETLSFFNDEIQLITELSFARGLALDQAESADVIIYNRSDSGVPAIFSSNKIQKAAHDQVKKLKIMEGSRNGGSTIQLPTGFLQMHRPDGTNQMQFHHNFSKINSLLNQR